MSKVIFKHEFIPSMGEINGKEFGVFTESAGYRTSEQIIKGFLSAGELLHASRAGAFDTDAEDPAEDPSLDVRDMELSEIGQLMNQVNDKLESSVSSSNEALKGAMGETGASVSPDTSEEKLPE